MPRNACVKRRIFAFAQRDTPLIPVSSAKIFSLSCAQRARPQRLNLCRDITQINTFPPVGLSIYELLTLHIHVPAGTTGGRISKIHSTEANWAPHSPERTSRVSPLATVPGRARVRATRLRRSRWRCEQYTHACYNPSFSNIGITQ